MRAGCISAKDVVGLCVLHARAAPFGARAAYGRIEAARAARRFPVILELLADGSVTLTTIRLLATHLTPENHRWLLEAARYKSGRDVEHQVAARHPQPAVRSIVRKLPQPKQPSSGQPTVSSGAAQREPLPVMAPAVPVVRPAVVKPLAPERYKVQFTVSRVTHDKLRRAQDLLRHTIPSGDPAAIFDKAPTLLLAQLEKKKLAAADRPRANRRASAGTRHVPAGVRREVWRRDGGQCAFVGAQGRCEERGFLEFHHVEPYAAGGKATAQNLELRCRQHNLYEADLFFGTRPPFLVRESRMCFAGASNSVRTESCKQRRPTPVGPVSWDISRSRTAQALPEIDKAVDAVSSPS